MKYLLTVILFHISCLLLAQDRAHNNLSFRTLTLDGWTNQDAFRFGPTPLISGFGELSDSLSIANDGTTFYEISGTYYPINSWADYYYWFTKRYWYRFKRPALEYEFYYLTNNVVEMINYIASPNYEGKYYPTTFTIEAPIAINRLVDRNYFIDSEKDLKKLNRFLNRELYAKNSSIERDSKSLTYIKNSDSLLAGYGDGSSKTSKGSKSTSNKSNTSRASASISN